MFARMSFLHGDPARLGELVDYVTWTVKPATDLRAGSRGVAMWVDRESGAALVVSVWSDETSMVASETPATQLRDDGAAVVRGIAIVERYETMLADVSTRPEVGNVMRLIRMSADPRDIDANVTWSRDSIVPVLRRVPGYLSYVVAASRGTGRAVSMSTYRDAGDAEIAYAATAPMRAAAVSRGITIDGVHTYEVALAGIRPGVATMPARIPVATRAPTPVPAPLG